MFVGTSTSSDKEDVRATASHRAGKRESKDSSADHVPDYSGRAKAPQHTKITPDHDADQASPSRSELRPEPQPLHVPGLRITDARRCDRSASEVSRGVAKEEPFSGISAFQARMQNLSEKVSSDRGSNVTGKEGNGDGQADGERGNPCFVVASLRAGDWLLLKGGGGGGGGEGGGFRKLGGKPGWLRIEAVSVG